MKHIRYASGVLLLLLGGGSLPAQNVGLDVESSSILYRIGRTFDPPTVDVLQEKLKPFYHGVASGDPLADRVIIWTRVTPDTLDDREIEVSWRVATDTALANTVRTGVFTTGAGRDYTVKVDVTGLEAGRTYYYGFSALGANSLTGRTRTTPTGSAVEQLKFGVVSCSNFEAGYFNAYGHLADRNDLDAILHLGDYIYETASALGERPVPGAIEVKTLFEYRSRYSTYRLDKQLMRAHQQHPFIAVWDDHEYADNSNAGGARGHQPTTEGDWFERKAQAKQAYFEWLPIRDPAGESIYRRIGYGNLADLFMLDTRIEARDQQIYDIEDPALQDTARTLLGGPQKQWLKEQLRESTARWKIIGQQVMFSPFNIGWAGLAIDRTYAEAENMFLDTWAGYPAERQEVIDFLEDTSEGDVVILTGSFHSSVAYEVVDTPALVSFTTVPGFGTIPRYAESPDYDPKTGRGAVAVEFLTPSITSANFDEIVDPAAAVQLSEQVNRPIRPNVLINLGNPNPHMKYADLLAHGYFVLDVDETGVQADYYYSNILVEASPERFDTALVSRWGEDRLIVGDGPAAPGRVQATPAPADPPLNSVSVASVSDVRLLSVYPNPASDAVYVQYGLERAGQVRIRVLDASGRQLGVSRSERQVAGLYTFGMEVSGLPRGVYYIEITAAGSKAMQTFVRP